MNLLRLVPFLVWALMPAIGYGQYKGTSVKDRIGDKLIGNRKAIDVYNEYASAFSKRDWEAAYKPWRELMTDIPYCTFALTYYGTAKGFLQELIKAENDSIQKYVYYEDIEEMLSYVENNLDAINSFDDTKHSTITHSDIQCMQAYFYWDLRNELGRGFILEEAYNKFAKAFNTVRKSNSDGNGDINFEIDYNTFGYLIEEYFKVCKELYELDKEENLERFLTDYIDCLESCDKMMSTFHNDSTKWRYFADRHNNVQAYFNQTGAGNVKNLVNYYTPLIEGNKKNASFLKNAIHLMMYNGCLNEDIFYLACEYSYLIAPNYENCIGLGQQTLFVDKSRDMARGYYDEALKLASNANERWMAARFTADALAQNPAPKKGENESNNDFAERYRQWRNSFSAPVSYYTTALENAQEAGVAGQYLGETYYKLSDCYRKMQKFDEAITALNTALEVYPAFTIDRYNKQKELIAREEKSAKETQERNLARLKTKRARELWEEQNRKRLEQQKAEEDFWKGK